MQRGIFVSAQRRPLAPETFNLIGKCSTSVSKDAHYKGVPCGYFYSMPGRAENALKIY